MSGTKQFISGISKHYFAQKFLNLLYKKDIIFAVIILGVLSFLIFPITPILIDFLLSISIAFSVLILLTVLFIDKPIDLSAFPTILLIATMFRLALNISTTRLILADGHLGPSAAGRVVEAFGFFVMQGSVVIGAIVFAILTVINFVVITKGSGRIAEVAARFSLDALPGKQMSIDADLSAGLINEEEAKKRRKELEDENTFFGSMDGANKFVRGDAIAGLIITFINFLGGLIIGMAQQNLDLNSALATYTLLTIGDGLVSQIPALIVSISAGLLVTKSGTHGSSEKAIFQQLGKFPHALATMSGLLIFMSFMPGIPMIPFFIIASLAGLMAYSLKKKKITLEKVETEEQIEGAQQEISHEEMVNQSLRLDHIRIELGYELLQVVDQNKEYKLTDQIKDLRKQIAKDLGFILPVVRIQDNLQLQAREYQIKVKDIICGRYELQPSRILLMNPNGGAIDIDGDEVTEPVFNLPAKWVDRTKQDEAVNKGYTVVEPITIISTHLSEVVKENITELLTYSETKKLLANLDEEQKKLADEVVPNKISVVSLQRILQKLLNESVNIRDLPAILEAIAEISDTTTNNGLMVEHIRARLAKQICFSLLNDDNIIPLVILSQEWEKAFFESLVGDDNNKQLAMPPSRLQEFVRSVNNLLENLARSNVSPILLTSNALRPFVRSVTERFKPNLMILSHNEIYPKIRIKNYGQVN